MQETNEQAVLTKVPGTATSKIWTAETLWWQPKAQEAREKTEMEREENAPGRYPTANDSACFL